MELFITLFVSGHNIWKITLLDMGYMFLFICSTLYFLFPFCVPGLEYKIPFRLKL